MLKQMGARIRTIRKGKNCDLLSVGRKTGIGAVRMERIEKGEINLRFYTLARIAEALAVDVSELVLNV